MRCLSCHYDLRNLTEHRCPECGRAFDPDDPSTFESAAEPVRPRIRHVLILWTVAFVIGYFLFWHWLLPEPSVTIEMLIIALPASGFAMVVTVIVWPVVFIAAWLESK